MAASASQQMQMEFKSGREMHLVYSSARLNHIRNMTPISGGATQQREIV